MAIERTPSEEYLAEVLALDPNEETGRIVELRREHLNPTSGGEQAGKSRSPLGAVASRLDRGIAESSLQAIHDSFWLDEFEIVRTRLEQLDLEEFPDLRRYRARLLRVNELRSELEDFEEDAGDLDFFYTLEAVLIAPEASAAELRQHYIDGSTSAQAWKASQKAVKALANYEGLYALERSWCGRIRSARQDLQDSRTINKRTGLWFLAAYFAIKLMFKLLGD